MLPGGGIEPGETPGAGRGPRAGRGVLAVGDRGASPLRRRPRRPPRVVLPGGRARRRAGARWRRGRGALRGQPLPAALGDGRGAARSSGCFPRGSPTSWSTPSGRCGSTRPEPGSGPSSSGCGSSTSTTSPSSGTAPRMPRACFGGRLGVVRRRWTGRPGRVPRSPRRPAVRLRAGAWPRTRPAADGGVLRDPVGAGSWHRRRVRPAGVRASSRAVGGAVPEREPASGGVLAAAGGRRSSTTWPSRPSAVPNKPHLPPDVWLTGIAPGA